MSRFLLVWEKIEEDSEKEKTTNRKKDIFFKVSEFD